ncbi:hypothetical protein KA005_27995, partial [bacterium]|nr:hypothetical protein [bacterium]
RNREAGVIIENEEVAHYYAEVFLYDWSLEAPVPTPTEASVSFEELMREYKNQFFIVLIFGMTAFLIARDWRKREWT